MAQTAPSPFFEINAANVITWLAMLVGFVAVWQKTKDKVETHGERLDRVETQIERFKTDGTPANTASLTVMRETVASHAVTIAEHEKILREISGIRTDVAWVAAWVRGQVDKQRERER